MTTRFPTAMLLVCAAGGVGCGSEEGLSPGGFEPEPPPVFTTLEVWPTAADLFVALGNTEVQLYIAARDETRTSMSFDEEPTYASSDAATAWVSSSGLVTAAAPGTAEVTAALTVGGVTRTASMEVTVYREVPDTYPEIAGVYDLSAPITSFDPAWGDLTGYRYTAVLTLQEVSRGRVEGTYADLQIIGPGTEPGDWDYTGFVRGTLDLDGRVVIELIGGNHTWTTWYGDGRLVSRSIEGSFGCCGYISGTFTAERR